MHRIDKLIEQRVMSCLKRMVEASKKRPAGDWSDIANGAGGSIYNRKTRAPKQESIKTIIRECQTLWAAMSTLDRYEMLTDMYSVADLDLMIILRDGPLKAVIDELIDGDDIESVKELRRNLRMYGPR